MHFFPAHMKNLIDPNMLSNDKTNFLLEVGTGTPKLCSI